jgi:hypothetical protein
MYEEDEEELEEENKEMKRKKSNVILVSGHIILSQKCHVSFFVELTVKHNSMTKLTNEMQVHGLFKLYPI